MIVCWNNTMILWNNMKIILRIWRHKWMMC